MRKVFKYEIDTTQILFYAPPLAKFVMAGRWDNKFWVWLEVEDRGLPDVSYGIDVIPTGEPIAVNMEHLQSVRDNNFVWHFYRNTDYARFAN